MAANCYWMFITLNYFSASVCLPDQTITCSRSVELLTIDQVHSFLILQEYLSVPSRGKWANDTILWFSSRMQQLACLHDQNKSSYFGGSAFIQPIRTIWIVFQKLWLAGKKPALQKSHFCFDHMNRLNVMLQMWREFEVDISRMKIGVIFCVDLWIKIQKQSVSFFQANNSYAIFELLDVNPLTFVELTAFIVSEFSE